jgi:hypothetical protein
MKPIVVILEAIEVMEWRSPGRGVTARPSPIGMEIPQLGHSPYGQACAFWGSMEIAHCIQPPVLVIHEPVHGVRGAVGAPVAVGARKAQSLSAKTQDGVAQGSLGHVLQSPFPKTA